MLKKRALNRIFLSSVTLFIALILYTFTFIKYEKPKNIVIPKSNKDIKKKKK